MGMCPKNILCRAVEEYGRALLPAQTVFIPAIEVSIVVKEREGPCASRQAFNDGTT
jgi:hypothetical protein